MENTEAITKRCTGEDEPLISIVMAVYHPRLDWLAEQLASLNAQTYQNLELLICDDGPDMPVDEAIFAKHITAFPWRLVRNEQNIGSNKTFERLTEMAAGEYIAYCDQDDVWLEGKLLALLGLMKQTGAVLVCSDMIVIDDEGRLVADSLSKVRKRHVFYSGEGLADVLLLRNFVTGCTMLMKTKLAKEACPFVNHMVHDHWLALFAAVKGKIEVAEKPLIQYRIHAENQTNVLAGIKTKQDYINKRIAVYADRLLEIRARVSLPQLNEVVEWVLARQEYGRGNSRARKIIWKYRRMNLTTSVFELVMLHMPEPIFHFALWCLKKGIL